MNEFQSKIQEAFQQAQTKAATRMRGFEQEARKMLETLGDRAQVFLEFAQKGSREQMVILGVELEKLGKRLQELAAKSQTKPDAGAPTQPN